MPAQGQVSLDAAMTRPGSTQVNESAYREENMAWRQTAIREEGGASETRVHACKLASITARYLASSICSTRSILLRKISTSWLVGSTHSRRALAMSGIDEEASSSTLLIPEARRARARCVLT